MKSETLCAIVPFGSGRNAFIALTAQAVEATGATVVPLGQVLDGRLRHARRYALLNWYDEIHNWCAPMQVGAS